MLNKMQSIQIQFLSYNFFEVHFCHATFLKKDDLDGLYNRVPHRLNYPK